VEVVVVVPKAQILDWIKDVLSTENRISSKKVTLASGIPTDLGVDGADAWELIEKLKKLGRSS
jgi:acyl carrier protein